MLDVSIENIEFNNQQSIDLEGGEIVVFVGPNNAGKSKTLKSINQYMINVERKCPIVKNIKTKMDGSVDDCKNYFIENVPRLIRNGDDQGSYHVNGGSIRELELPIHFNNIRNRLNLNKFFLKYLNTENRQSLVKSINKIDYASTPAMEAYHLLDLNFSLEEKLDKYIYEAFGGHSILNKWSGSTLHLHYGDKVEISDEEFKYTKKCLDKLSLCTTNITEQGDGIKCYTAILLHTLLANNFITIIDEPEVFLHPPQARLLGQMISREKKDSQQYFISTHSADFIKGLLSSENNNVKIVRITRDGDINPIKILDNNEVKEIWKDSLLRHSNIIEGLFYDQVIICESDSDCRFYSTIFNSIYDKASERRPDILWTHGGGIGRVSHIMKYLKPLGVKVKTILDFDILKKNDILKKIYSMSGGSWEDITILVNSIKFDIENKSQYKDLDEIKGLVIRELENIRTGSVSRTKAEKIKKILLEGYSWKEVKESGIDFLENKDNFSALDLKLQNNGIFILPYGEVESLDKSINTHGPEWVNSVLESRDLNDSSILVDAKEFIQKVIETN